MQRGAQTAGTCRWVGSGIRFGLVGEKRCHRFFGPCCAEIDKHLGAAVHDLVGSARVGGLDGLRAGRLHGWPRWGGACRAIGSGPTDATPARREKLIANPTAVATKASGETVAGMDGGLLCTPTAIASRANGRKAIDMARELSSSRRHHHALRLYPVSPPWSSTRCLYGLSGSATCSPVAAAFAGACPQFQVVRRSDPSRERTGYCSLSCLG